MKSVNEFSIEQLESAFKLQGYLIKVKELVKLHRYYHETKNPHILRVSHLQEASVWLTRKGYIKGITIKFVGASVEVEIDWTDYGKIIFTIGGVQ